MIGTFKSNVPYNYFLLFFYGLILYIPSFIHPMLPVSNISDTPLYAAILNLLNSVIKSYTIVYSIISFVLLYSQSIMLNKLVNTQRLLTRPTYLTGMCYLLFTSSFNLWYGLSGSLISASILIWILSRLCSLQHNSNAKSTLFNISLLLGLSTFFYFPSVVFLILILAGNSILRPFKLSEWLIIFIGLITPYYFLASINFIFGYRQIDLKPFFHTSIPLFLKSLNEYIVLFFMVIPVLFGIYWVQKNMMRLLIQSRKTWLIIYVFMSLSFIVPFLSKTSHFNNYRIMAIPFSVFSASFFLFPPVKWLASILHWGIIVMIAYAGYKFILY